MMMTFGPGFFLISFYMGENFIENLPFILYIFCRFVQE